MVGIIAILSAGLIGFVVGVAVLIQETTMFQVVGFFIAIMAALIILSLFGVTPF